MPAKDPYCCLPEKLRAVTEAFDRGALTTLRSLRYAAQQLSREDLLVLIDSQIADLGIRVETSERRDDDQVKGCGRQA